MKIKRYLYNTIAILVVFVLVFGGFSQVAAETVVPDGWQPVNPPSQPTNDDPLYFQGANGQVMISGQYPPGILENLVNQNKDPKTTKDPLANQVLNPTTEKPDAAAGTGGVPQTQYKQITNNVLGCSVGQLLASIITTGITTALNGLNNLLGVWTGFPVHDAQLNATQGFSAATSHGFQIFGVYVGVSLDSIAYCIINSILEYIANATIQWANSGFNGNPAFIQNPQRFFQGLADQQASAFIRALAYNSSSAGPAMNVCAPFRKNVALSLAKTYGTYGNANAANGGYAPSATCGLSPNAQNNLLQGRSGANMFTNMSTAVTGSNNLYVDQMLGSQGALRGTIAQQNYYATQKANWGNGTMPYTQCTNPNDPNTCNITTPSTFINGKVQNTLNSGQNRLVAATKFDQVVSAIVNNLIRVVLSKLLQKAGTQGINIPPINVTGGGGYGAGANNTGTIYNANGIPYPGTSVPPPGVQAYDSMGRPIQHAQAAQ